MTDNDNLRGPRGSERLVAQPAKKSSIFGLGAKPDNDLTARMMMGATPQSIGAELRALRIERGESTADVAQHLRLRENYIVAIEAGNFVELPGSVYTIGFLRSYARYLKLDADALIQRFKEEASEIPHPTELTFFEPVSEESRVPRGGLVAFAVLLAVVAYAGWYYLSTRDMTISDLVPAVPEQFAGLVAPTGRSDPPPPTMAESGELSPPGPGDSFESLSGEAGLVDGAPPAPHLLGAAEAGRDPAVGREIPQIAQTIPSQASVQSEIVAAGERVGPVVYGEGNIGSRITLRATGDSWIQVRAADDTPLLTRILRVGDSYLVPNQPGLKLMTGNAGVLDVVVDGRSVPSLGPAGSVRRNVQLEPERLKAGTAVVN